MRKSRFIVLSIIFLMVGMSTAWAQNMDCLGWKNPTNFTFTGGTANSHWSGLTGTKNQTASTCDALGSSLTTTILAANLEQTTAASSYCYTENNSTNTLSKDIHNATDNMRRFVIKGSGGDPETGGRLSYLPPDPSFTSSIRLGNYCGGAEAEAISYQMTVNNNNALMTVWFALSLQNGQHTAAANPEFVIRIERAVTNSSGQITSWTRIGGDTLCYVRPTPAGSSSDVTPFFVGYNSNVLSPQPSHTGADYACNIYLPWQKVIVNLYKYLYQTIRITIASGDCAYSAHYANAYIAGDCQPMKLQANGCAAGATSQVAEIKAPKGMQSYQWYRSRTGVLSGPAQTNDANYLQLAGATDSILMVTMDHFRNLTTNDTLLQNTFKCVMTSVMNLNENIPVVSTLYTEVGNMKPTLSIDSVLYCDGTVELQDMSMVPFTDNQVIIKVDTSATLWQFYNTTTPGLLPVATITGGKASHHFENAGAHCVRVRTSSYVADPETNERTCWNEKVVQIRSIRKPAPVIELQRNDLCSGDTIALYDRTPGSIYHHWHLYNDSGLDTIIVRNGASLNAIQFTFTETTTVDLITHDRSTYRADTNNSGVLVSLYCDTTTSTIVRVGQFPVLEVLGDTIVCNGTQSEVRVASDVEGCTYDWYTFRYGAPIQTNTATLITNPTDDVRYFVKVTSPNGCVSWDSLDITIVKPTLNFRTKYGNPAICTGDTAVLWAGKAAGYEWTAEPDNDATFWGQEGFDTIRVSPLETTTYTVVGKGTNGCTTSPLHQKITVYPYPIMAILLTPDYIDSENPSVQFSDVSQYGTSSLWNFGNGNTSTIRSVVHTFTDLSQDSLQISLLTGNALGCSRDTSFWVPIGIFTVWFPNAFTPRLESNNIFVPFTANDLVDYELSIYDRSGVLVFYTNDPKQGWDGTYKGVECKQGAYVYISSYRRPGVERLMSQKGTVTLLR